NEKYIYVVMTNPTCNSGTERCWEVIKNQSIKPDFIINLQGDNPLCPPWFLQQLINTWKNSDEGEVFTPFVQLNWQEYDTLVAQKKETPYSGTCVVLDRNNLAITFSKNMIPSIREIEKERVKPLSPICRHIGLYAYTYNALKAYLNLPKSKYEDLEGLEQLRFIENRIPVKMVEVSYLGREGMNGVDSQEDLERAETIIQKFGEFNDEY
ncbi:MAG: cytidylyltransferase domain-containing protein, partial [Chitinophagaceae bacterium]